MNLVEFENKYNQKLLSVRYKHINLWLLLRIKFKLASVLSETNYNFNIRTSRKLELVKNLVYGIFHIFKLFRFEFLFFSNTEKRIKINDKYFDVFFDKISDILGRERSLYIEFAENKHIPHKQIHSAFSMSDLPFKVFSKIVSFFVNINRGEGVNVLEEISKELNLSICIKRELKLLIGEYYVYKFLFKLHKPKGIFVICYYSKMPLVLAAREVGITVYEAQHGVINENNDYYNSLFSRFEMYFPSHLLSFGEDLVLSTPEYFIFSKKQIFPIGSFYLNYIKMNFTDDYLNRLREEYDKVVCVTSQGIYFDELMSFIEVLSEHYPKFIFVLRLKRDENPIKYLRSNIILLNQYDIYQVLKYSDYNVTIYSMVAIEANFFGVCNVLLNVNGLSQKYLPHDIDGVLVNPIDAGNFKFPINARSHYNSHNKYQKAEYEKNILMFSNQILNC